MSHECKEGVTCEPCKGMMDALGITSYPKEEGLEVGDVADLWTEHAAMYKHNKERNVLYLERFECIKGMKRNGGTKFAGLVGGKWKLLDLYDYEKELIRKEMMIEKNKQRYGGYRSKIG